MKNIINTTVLITLLALGACTVAPTATPTPALTPNIPATVAAIVQATQTAAPTIVPTATSIPPTATSIPPTATPISPTATPISPTATRDSTKPISPTATTDFKKPIYLNGRGDSVVELNKYKGPMGAKINHTGNYNFVVKSIDKDGTWDLLINTIGNYSGIKLLDITVGSDTRRFEIKADGNWTVDLIPLVDLQRLYIPGRVSGHGDSVVLLFNDENADIIKATAKMRGFFSVYALSAEGKIRVFNKISPYEGEQLLPKEPYVLIIEAPSDWTLEISAKNK